MPSLEPWWLDLKHACRALAASRGFAVTATLSLALGIGTSTAAFSVWDAVLLRSLPVRDPASLAVVTTRNAGSQLALSHAGFMFLRDRATTLDGLAAFRVDSAQRRRRQRHRTGDRHAGVRRVLRRPRRAHGPGLADRPRGRSGSRHWRPARARRRRQSRVLGGASRQRPRRDRAGDPPARPPRHDRRRRAARLQRHGDRLHPGGVCADDVRHACLRAGQLADEPAQPVAAADRPREAGCAVRAGSG